MTTIFNCYWGPFSIPWFRGCEGDFIGSGRGGRGGKLSWGKVENAKRAGGFP